MVTARWRSERRGNAAIIGVVILLILCTMWAGMEFCSEPSARALSKDYIVGVIDPSPDYFTISPPYLNLNVGDPVGRRAYDDNYAYIYSGILQGKVVLEGQRGTIYLDINNTVNVHFFEVFHMTGSFWRASTTFQLDEYSTYKLVEIGKNCITFQKLNVYKSAWWYKRG